MKNPNSTVLVRCLFLAILSVAVSGGCQDAPTTPVQKAFVIDPQNASPANGVWAGRWKADGDPGEGKSLVCETIQTGEDSWTATFNAVCDKDYSFTMDMPGRRVGEEVLFKVTVNLGEDYGGEYHWTGRVIGEQFNGEYTNAKYNGTFRMTRTTEALLDAGVSCEVLETADIADVEALTEKGDDPETAEVANTAP